jgi:hypothetical protein
MALFKTKHAYESVFYQKKQGCFVAYLLVTLPKRLKARNRINLKKILLLDPP